jgi:hypothetical protein
MNIKQKIAILDVFKCALAETKEVNSLNEISIKEEVLKYGFICDEYVDWNVVLDWVKKNNFNPNKTFYKTIEDVTDRSRLQLFIEQLLHYASTYGTDFQGEPFYINDTPIEVHKLNVTLIKSISEEEVVSRCQNMLYSGVALSQNTIENLLLIIDNNFEIDKVKNREAQAIISVNKGVYPLDGESALRCLIYSATGNTLLIKDKNTIKQLKASSIIIPDILLDRFSKIFFRFKPLFLALKKCNQYKINRIRRMAKHNHVAFKQPFWNTILNKISKEKDTTKLLKDAEKYIGNLTIFKMIALYNQINLRVKAKGEYDLYIIRNNKMYIKESNAKEWNEKIKDSYLNLQTILYNNIIKRVKNNIKDNIVELPFAINLCAPTSEKNFMGEIPLYSWIDLDFDDAIIGINWHEDNGASDLDLSYIDRFSGKIGWNERYYNAEKSIVYSGDMTTAPDGATELLYKKAQSFETVGTVKVNLYNTVGGFRDRECGYKVFFAKESVDIEDKLNYMVNPDNIIYSYDSKIIGENIIGTLLNDKFIFANIHTSNSRVSSKTATNDILLDIFKKRHPHFLTINKILKDAKITTLYKVDKVLAKDDILKLFM